MKRSLLALIGLAALVATPASAQDAGQTQAAADKAAEEKLKEGFKEEVVVVSASKVETTLINAPATMSVVGAETIATSPAQNYGDLLRSTSGPERDPDVGPRHQHDEPPGHDHPGQLAARAARRPLDLPRLLRPGALGLRAPEPVRDQADRGGARPGLGGVGRQRPDRRREHHHQVARATPRASTSTCRAASSTATTARARTTAPATSTAPTSRTPRPRARSWSYRLSAGYFNSDPFSRPTGTRAARLPSPRRRPLPNGQRERCRRLSRPGGALSRGPRVAGASRTTAPASPRSTCASTRSWARRQRRPHHLPGRLRGHRPASSTPASVPSTSRAARTWATARSQWTRKGALKLGVFANFSTPRRRTCCSPTPPPAGRCSSTSRPRPTTSRSATRPCSGGKHILSYGGNARRNNFDITLAPNAEDRNEFGAYFQEEFFFDQFRLAVGARVDKFGNIDDAVFSPRVTVMFKPAPRHSIRALLQPGLPLAVGRQQLPRPGHLRAHPVIDLRPLGAGGAARCGPLIPSSRSSCCVKNKGSEVVDAPVPTSKEESLDAYELAYTGTVGQDHPRHRRST